MSRTLFIILFTVAILASYMTVYEAINKTSDPSLEASESEPPNTNPPLPTTWPVVTSRKPAALTATPATTEVLPENSVLIETRNQLQVYASRLARLRQIRAERLQQTNIIHPYLLNQRSYDLEDIQNQLDQNRASQIDLNQNVQQSLEAQYQQIQMTRDELNWSIQELAENIRNIQVQFDYNLVSSPEIITGIAREQYFNDLRSSLAAQVEQLNTLRAERANLNTNFAIQNQFLQAQTQNQKDDLLQEQIFLQEQILSIRNEIREIQDTNQQIQMSMIPLDQQIEQAEKDYQTVSEKLNSLRQ